MLNNQENDPEARSSVDTTLSGLEALSMIKKDVYDIIITDIRLPDANGLETTQAGENDQ